MTDATIGPAGPDHQVAFPAATFGDALRSEWTKLRTVRSTFWALTVTVVLGIALGAVISAGCLRAGLAAGAHAELAQDRDRLRDGVTRGQPQAAEESASVQLPGSAADLS